MTDTYHIQVAEFDGPFDLILFFIEKDELDIYDIPIAQICDDFLSYINQMEQLDIDLAAEFILVAATLMRIKAKTLIPRKEVNELGEEIDPRAELVEKLLEYKRYKGVLKQLEDLAHKRDNIHPKPLNEGELKVIAKKYATELEMESVNLFKLLKVFNKVVNRFEDEKNKPVHKIIRYNYTIGGQKEKLTNFLTMRSDWTPFEMTFQSCKDKMEAIFRLLAILELIQLRKLELRTGDGYNAYWLKANEESPAEADVPDIVIE